MGARRALVVHHKNFKVLIAVRRFGVGFCLRQGFLA
jgi:hypothetical protein